MDSENMDNDSEEQVLKILSNPIRATIVKKLYDDSLTFTHLMQLTGCKTGQLSFHLKKLDYLVEQDELKRYRLSKKGKEDVEAILPMLGNNEKDNSYSCDNLSGEEDNGQLGFAFKQFWDSLGLLIFSFMSAIKQGVLYVLDSLKAEAGLSSTKKKTSSLFLIVQSRVTSVLKAGRKASKPAFCYLFLILGLLLFIPAVFSLAHPAFDSTLNSAARIRVYEMTPEEISFANDLYAKEMLPDQRNFQENDFQENDSLLMSKAMYYEYRVGFPLSVQKIEAWNEARVPARIQFLKDFILSGLILSIVLLLLGGILAYSQNSLLKRAINSSVTASVLLILIVVYMLLVLNAFVTWGYSYPNIVFNNASLMLKHLIALLLLLLFLSSSGLLFMMKKKQEEHVENEGINKTLPQGSEEETFDKEISDEDDEQIEKDQTYLIEKSTTAEDGAYKEKILVGDDGEKLYCWDERKGPLDSL